MTNLQILRLKKGLSQKKLAVQLCIHPSTMNQIEGGWFSRPPAGIDSKLKDFFGPKWTWTRLMQEPPTLQSEQEALNHDQP